MKKIHIILCLIVLPAILLAQTAQNELLKAKAYLDQKKPTLALEILSAMPEKHNNLLIIKWKGDCYYQEQDYINAVHYYLIADSVRKDVSSFELSCCFAKMNDNQKALDWLKKYLALRDKKSEIEIIKENAFQKLSRGQQWQALWKQNWYSDIETERNAIKALIARGNSAEALSELENYEQKFSPRHEYFYLLSQIYNNQHLLAPALTAINKAISLFSQSGEYLAFRASLTKQTKKYHDGVDDMTKAIRLDPYNLSYYLNRGELARLAVNYIMAEKDLQLYMELFPDAPEAYYQFGMLESARKNYQNAMDMFDVLIAKDQAHAQYFIDRGNVAFRLEQIQKADNDYGMALDLDPTIQEAYLKKGKTRYMLGDPSRACYYWEKAQCIGSAEAAKLLYKNCRE